MADVTIALNALGGRQYAGAVSMGGGNIGLIIGRRIVVVPAVHVRVLDQMDSEATLRAADTNAQAAVAASQAIARAIGTAPAPVAAKADTVTFDAPEFTVPPLEALPSVPAPAPPQFDMGRAADKPASIDAYALDGFPEEPPAWIPERGIASGKAVGKEWEL